MAPIVVSEVPNCRNTNVLTDELSMCTCDAIECVWVDGAFACGHALIASGRFH